MATFVRIAPLPVAFSQFDLRKTDYLWIPHQGGEDAYFGADIHRHRIHFHITFYGGNVPGGYGKNYRKVSVWLLPKLTRLGNTEVSEPTPNHLASVAPY